jgi:hypothetical protein
MLIRITNDAEDKFILRQSLIISKVSQWVATQQETTARLVREMAIP